MKGYFLFMVKWHKKTLSNLQNLKLPQTICMYIFELDFSNEMKVKFSRFAFKILFNMHFSAGGWLSKISS